jgi:sporulation protein YtfJ
MENRPVSDLMGTTMEKLKEMIDANAIVGEPISTADGITLIPVSKVSYGFVGGGSDFLKKPDSKSGFGGGSGAGVNITPVAFIVIKNGNASMIYITPPELSTVDRIIDTVPEVMDKITDFLGKEKEE